MIMQANLGKLVAESLQQDLQVVVQVTLCQEISNVILGAIHFQPGQYIALGTLLAVL